MPVPTNLPNGGTTNKENEPGKYPRDQPLKSQKSMTKAERRELQEKQRAAKAQQKQPQPSGSGPPQASTSSSGRARGGSIAAPSTPKKVSQKDHAANNAAPVSDLADTKQRGPRIFAHFGLTRHVNVNPKNAIVIHPAIQRLALQFSQFKITGANARCIATLTAFKSVIEDYVTPPHNTLSRHLMTHISPQITHLVAARPMSVTMGNAIRQLKLEISNSDIDLPEQDAKVALCDTIDNYLRDRIFVADEVICETAGRKIKDGDVILTYARSSIVEKVLLRAHEDGKQFSVIIVDSRPMLEGTSPSLPLPSLFPTPTLTNIPSTGKTLLSKLTTTTPPIQCTYLLLPALPSVITEVTTVFLGAHSLHSNGAVYSRAGTALVAMLARQHNVPTLVCCETYKFAEGVQLDGFTRNELAPLDLLAHSFPLSKPRDQLMLTSKPNLAILNPLYDLTPPNNITAVVTEVGLVPPSSISSIPLAMGRQTV